MIKRPSLTPRRRRLTTNSSAVASVSAAVAVAVAVVAEEAVVVVVVEINRSAHSFQATARKRSGFLFGDLAADEHKLTQTFGHTVMHFVFASVFICVYLWP